MGWIFVFIGIFFLYGWFPARERAIAMGVYGVGFYKPLLIGIVSIIFGIYLLQ